MHKTCFHYAYFFSENFNVHFVWSKHDVIHETSFQTNRQNKQCPDCYQLSRVHLSRIKETGSVKQLYPDPDLWTPKGPEKIVRWPSYCTIVLVLTAVYWIQTKVPDTAIIRSYIQDGDQQLQWAVGKVVPDCENSREPLVHMNDYQTGSCLTHFTSLLMKRCSEDNVHYWLNAIKGFGNLLAVLCQSNVSATCYHCCAEVMCRQPSSSGVPK